MKFLCVECDEQMHFSDRRVPGDGTLSAVFRCPSCGRSVGMLTNPMETRLVSSLGVEIGGETVPGEGQTGDSGPLAATRAALEGGRDEVLEEGEPEAPRGEESSRPSSVEWSDAALRRLEAVPRFVRGMVRRIYTDYAKERGIALVTPDVMDRARSDLGLEGM